MLNQLMLQSFKCYKKINFKFKNLNIYTGYNSAGKSSVIDSMCLIQQSILKSSKLEKIWLNGELINLGTAAEVLNAGSKEKITWDFTINGKVTQVSSIVTNRKDLSMITQTSEFESLEEEEVFFDYFKKMHFKSAECFGSEGRFEYYDFEGLTIGRKGENSLSLLYGQSEVEIQEECRFGNETVPPTMIHQVNFVLNFLFPGIRLEIEKSPTREQLVLNYYSRGINIRPSNVGYGVSSTLPIIIGCFDAAVNNKSIYIQNPEIHIHPETQTKLAKILAKFAESGVQIIVETHSDHIVNGVRIGVLENLIDSENVMFNFLKFHKGMSQPENFTPKIDSQARFDQWPDGFFDEWDLSLEKILRLGEGV